MSEQASARRNQDLGKTPEKKPVNAWVVGFVAFAGIAMVMIGVFQVIQGVVAIFKNEFYVATPNYMFEFDVTAWGWIHVLIGAVLAVVGFMVFSGRAWARALGIAFAVLNSITQFLFLPYYPVWSLLMIALDIVVIWALCVYNRDVAERAGY